jgi:hypothetical protein
MVPVVPDNYKPRDPIHVVAIIEHIPETEGVHASELTGVNDTFIGTVAPGPDYWKQFTKPGLALSPDAQYFFVGRRPESLEFSLTFLLLGFVFLAAGVFGTIRAYHIWRSLGRRG